MSDPTTLHRHRWWEPVHESQNAALRQRIMRAASFYFTLSILLRSFWYVLYLQQINLTEDPHALAPGLALAYGYILWIIGLHKKRWQWSTFVMISMEMCFWCGWMWYDIHQGPLWTMTHGQVLLLVILVSSIRIKPSLLFATGSLQGWLLALEIYYTTDDGWIMPLLMIVLGILAGAFAALSSQIQRHLVRRLGQQHQQFLAKERIFTLHENTHHLMQVLLTPLAKVQQQLQSTQTQRALLQQMLHQDTPLTNTREQLRALQQAFEENATDFQVTQRHVQQLQQHTQNLHQRQSLNFTILSQLKESSLQHAQSSPRQITLHWEDAAPETTLQGDPDKLTILWSNLLHWLDQSLPASETSATVTLTHTNAQTTITLRTPTRAHTDTAHHNLSLARDIARGIFEGDLTEDHTNTSTLSVTLQRQLLAQDKRPAFVPGFKTTPQALLSTSP